MEYKDFNDEKIDGERKGQNKYYPPDFDHNKHFSLNSYHGVHALRERGARAHEGILIIRFEMPFNCWCLTCNKPIGMGVRYNSEKTKVGNFYSTPIYQFKMRCHLCAGDIIIQTDPEHFQYVIISGARRREQRYEAKDVELPELADTKTKSKLALDPMFHLEHASKDEELIKTAKPNLKKLLKSSNLFYDDFHLNQMARKRFREEKKIATGKQEYLDKLSENMSIVGSEIKLLPCSERDKEAAKFQMKKSGLDMSTKAIDKRKAQLIKTLKSRALKKPSSKYLPLVKGIFSSTKTKLSKNTQINSESFSTSLVSEDYNSSDENDI